MQLLHIADLHFGRLLYGRSLMDDQRHFVRQSLLPALDEYKPDALLIAGDLYDRQIASVDAIHLFDELIDALCERSIPAVIISGNHDSPDRIAVGKSLLARHGIHIITELKDAFTPVEIGNIQIFPLPYFENAQMREMPACARRWKKWRKRLTPRKSTFWSRTALRRGPPPPIPKAAFSLAARVMCRQMSSPRLTMRRSGTYTRRKGQATRRATRAHRSNIP